MANIILPVIDSNSIGWTFNTPVNASASVIVQASVTSTSTTLGAGVQLVGDVTSPGANMVYGTNASGVKGWYAH